MTDHLEGPYIDRQRRLGSLAGAQLRILFLARDEHSNRIVRGQPLQDLEGGFWRQLQSHKSSSNSSQRHALNALLYLTELARRKGLLWSDVWRQYLNKDPNYEKLAKATVGLRLNRFALLINNTHADGERGFLFNIFNGMSDTFLDNHYNTLYKVDLLLQLENAQIFVRALTVAPPDSPRDTRLMLFWDALVRATSPGLTMHQYDRTLANEFADINAGDASKKQEILATCIQHAFSDLNPNIGHFFLLAVYIAEQIKNGLIDASLPEMHRLLTPAVNESLFQAWKDLVETLRGGTPHTSIILFFSVDIFDQRFNTDADLARFVNDHVNGRDWVRLCFGDDRALDFDGRMLVDDD